MEVSLDHVVNFRLSWDTQKSQLKREWGQDRDVWGGEENVRMFFDCYVHNEIFRMFISSLWMMDAFVLVFLILSRTGTTFSLQFWSSSLTFDKLFLSIYTFGLCIGIVHCARNCVFQCGLDKISLQVKNMSQSSYIHIEVDSVYGVRVSRLLKKWSKLGLKPE